MAQLLALAVVRTVALEEDHLVVLLSALLALHKVARVGGQQHVAVVLLGGRRALRLRLRHRLHRRGRRHHQAVLAHLLAHLQLPQQLGGVGRGRVPRAQSGAIAADGGRRRRRRLRRRRRPSASERGRRRQLLRHHRGREGRRLRGRRRLRRRARIKEPLDERRGVGVAASLQP